MEPSLPSVMIAGEKWVGLADPRSRSSVLRALPVWVGLFYIAEGGRRTRLLFTGLETFPFPAVAKRFARGSFTCGLVVTPN